ncbi:hypothetical protein GTQ40_02090 [Flavobacteriaceae bacterium R38]|nr:hypothetical protein [Flavobacteriaceae bacterium R38]
MVHYLCYISSERRELKEEDLVELLSGCRKYNIENNITGLMLYFEGHFVEFMEGDKEAVHARFKNISSDKRHKSVFKITESSIEKRKFSNWTMSFPSLNKDRLRKIFGYRPFEKEIVLDDFSPDDSHPGLVLVRSFMIQSKRKQLQYS